MCSLVLLPSTLPLFLQGQQFEPFCVCSVRRVTPQLYGHLENRTLRLICAARAVRRLLTALRSVAVGASIQPPERLIKIP